VDSRGTRMPLNATGFVSQARHQPRKNRYDSGLHKGRRSMGFQGIFYANYLQLTVFELEDPGSVFDLIKVV
jgi:hypothetical protein